MKILYASGIEKQIEKIYKGSNVQVKDKLHNIIETFKEAENFFEILQLKHLNPHQLIANREKQWAVKVGNTKYRVIFYLCNEKNEPIIEKNSDIINKAKNIQIIFILEVSNKHYGK